MRLSIPVEIIPWLFLFALGRSDGGEEALFGRKNNKVLKNVESLS